MPNGTKTGTIVASPINDQRPMIRPRSNMNASSTRISADRPAVTRPPKISVFRSWWIMLSV